MIPSTTKIALIFHNERSPSTVFHVETEGEVTQEERERHTFHRRQAQLPRNLRVLDLPRLLQRHPPHQLGHVARTRDRAPAPESLEFHIRDRVRGRVDLDLQLHDVAACGGPHESCAHVRGALGHRADVARGGVVVEYFFMVVTAGCWLLA